ncbi:MAG: CDP-diacylglycerol--glycerol-3-phosphate 3-phosphatidyltransferase [Lachnospiraceae bacterium]|nr:CDP-diacylglycerol--glycerol-3-phosphate 3-phosphatidyltransferase [Lachnospiraceae bacterium]
MNLPNKLTMLRVIMVPFFVAFLLLTPEYPNFKWVALILFAVASLTDLLDGYIARKYHLVTNFGKFMDPLADKLLVSAALVCLTALGKIPAWMTIVIISREFIISGFRLIAAERGIVIAAGWLGKWKTAVTMIMLVMMLLVVNGAGIVFDPTETMGVYGWLLLIADVLLWISVILTVVSLIDYLVKNKDVMKDEA